MSTANVIQLPLVGSHKRLDAVKQVRAQVDSKVTFLMEGLDANVADALFEEMQHLSEQDALACHFNIMRAFRADGRSLAIQFALLMNKSWINLAHRRDQQAIANAPVDLTPLLKRLSDKNLNHYKILLEEIRLRFSWLARRPMAFHPLLPGNFYLCFWHATETLHLNYQERKLLLPLFNRFVMDRFGQVLFVTNQTLMDLDVPAESE